MKIITFFITLIYLYGCIATLPTQAERENADYGEYPHDAENIVKQYLKYQLKDAETAKWKLELTPQQGGFAEFRNIIYGFYTCYMINGKNSYGGYTGYKLHYFLIRNGTVVKHETSYRASNGCIDKGHKPPTKKTKPKEISL